MAESFFGLEQDRMTPKNSLQYMIDIFWSLKKHSRGHFSIINYNGVVFYKTLDNVGSF